MQGSSPSWPTRNQESAQRHPEEKCGNEDSLADASARLDVSATTLGIGLPSRVPSGREKSQFHGMTGPASKRRERRNSSAAETTTGTCAASDPRPAHDHRCRHEPIKPKRNRSEGLRGRRTSPQSTAQKADALRIETVENHDQRAHPIVRDLKAAQWLPVDDLSNGKPARFNPHDCLSIRQNRPICLSLL